MSRRHTVRVFLKGGNFFDLKAGEVKVQKNGFGLQGISWNDLKDTRPMYIDIEEVQAVIKL